MKIKVDRVNEGQLQKEIDKKWKEVKANEPCSLKGYSITDYISKLDGLFDCLGREVDDYNDAKVRFRHTVKGGFDINSKCLNFNMVIENGEFYLVDLIYEKVSSKTKHLDILLKPEYSVEEEKKNCKFKYGEIDGVKILMFDDIARLRFAYYPVEFDYKIDGLEEFIGLIRGFTENLADNTKERLLVNLIKHIRGSRIRSYIS
ncbi:hypothetical protein ACXR6G_11555 [Ancylomarina sp. YFZ004]